MAAKQNLPLRDAIQDLRTSSSEDEVRSLLREIFVALGLKQWRLEYPLSTGVADMVNFPARIVIETKKPGFANPHAKSANDESQIEQLSRYVSGIIDQRTIFERSDEIDEWRGYLTDGERWWGYQWNDGPRKLIPIPQVQGISVHFDVEPFSDFVHQHFKRRTPGKDIPPDDIASTLVDPLMEPLSSLQRNVESEIFYQTKIGLWRKILQGSGIVPSDSSPLNQSYVFLRHSVIVALARMLIAYLNNASAHASELVSNTLEGFQGWITEVHTGVQLLTVIGENIRKYDWRGSARDVLKEVYHGLIDPVHRQEFGEYYTPDHLAREIVRYTLDDEWCDDAIVRVHHIISGHNGVSTENLGVLDPSCGSGTFLYHAARKILGRISTNHLTLKSKSPLIVSRLVHGIDVNPIAVEMAKATLAMALPATPGGIPKLRVALADAMQTKVGPVFEKLGLYISTPAERSFFVPDEIVSHPKSDSLIEAAVEAVVQRQKLRIDPSDYGDRVLERVEELSNSLTPIIEKESNHVWVWHLENAIEFARMSRDRVGRLIGNPPWLVRNETPDGTRKKDIQRLGKELGLVERLRGSSAKGDLAAIFTARVTDLYLGNTPNVNRFAWVLPGSALINQTWKVWRRGFRSEMDNVELDRAWNLDDVNPPIFDHAPNGTCVVFGRKIPDDPQEVLQVLKWSGEFDVAEITEQKKVEVEISPYFEAVQRGAFYSPEPLFLVDRFETLPDQLVSVSTKPGSKKKLQGRWFGAEFCDVLIEQAALLPVYRNQDLKPFNIHSSAYLTVVIDENRLRFIDPMDCEKEYPRLHAFWLQAEERFQERKGESALDTLFENLDWRKYLSKQLRVGRDDRKYKVVYNKSGKEVQAARIANHDIAGQTLYYLITKSDEEALFVCGVLNAPCMQQMFRDRRTSKNDFHKSVFKFTPVPLFDPDNELHSQVVNIAKQLEDSSSKDLTLLNDPVHALF